MKNLFLDSKNFLVSLCKIIEKEFNIPASTRLSTTKRIMGNNTFDVNNYSLVISWKNN